MSTRQSLEIVLDADRRQQAAMEAERRQLELARLRAERAADFDREVTAIAHAHEQLTRQVVGRSAEGRERLRIELEALAERARAAGIRLDSIAAVLAESAEKLRQAHAELGLAIGRLEALGRDAAHLEAELAAAGRVAGGALVETERTASAALTTADRLAAAAALGAAFQARQRDLDVSIRRLEAQVRFVTQRADLTPVAMVTLQAMEDNGYFLRDATSREGLDLYFEKEGAAHQLAVRMAPEENVVAGVDRWDLLAETFGIVGPSCLVEMDDFETALEERGRLRRKGDRVYPRPDIQAVIPPPTTRPLGLSPARTAQATKALDGRSRG